MEPIKARLRWAVLLVGVALCCCLGLAASYAPPTLPDDYFFADSFARGTLDGWVTSGGRKQAPGSLDTDAAYTKYDGKWEVEELARARESSPGGPADALRGDSGLVLKSKAAHAAISAKLRRPFAFAGERAPLVLQYEVNFQRGVDCGGAYVKLLSHDPALGALDLGAFTDRTPYTVMFGPDKCGDDFKLHLIFKHRNPLTGELREHHAKKPTKDLKALFTDKKTHLYTLVLDPADHSFLVEVDGEAVNGGSLLTDVVPALNAPQEIADPEDAKPEDWDDRRSVPDPDAVKPPDWDEDQPREVPDQEAAMPDGWLEEEPESIEDPAAVRPEDWDDDMDGEWEPPHIGNPRCSAAAGVPGCGPWLRPTVPNPAYKGKWKPPKVANPAYRGEWKPRTVPNPDHVEDLRPFAGMSAAGAVGLELWSMSSDIFFDNFLVAGEREAAALWAEEGWRPKRQAEDAAAEAAASAEAASEEEETKGEFLRRVVVDWPAANRGYAATLLAAALLLAVAAIYASGKGKKAVPKSHYKKTDEPQPDVKDDEEEEEEEDKKKEEEEDDAVKYHQTYK